jgi:phenylalanyl-tRNA synthetase alpha chain
MDTKDQLKLNILAVLKTKPNQSTLDLKDTLNKPHNDIVGECKSLEMAEIITLGEPKEKKYISLTQDGQDVLDNGSPEVRVVGLLKSTSGVTKKAISEQLGKAGDRGFSSLMKAKLISYDKSTDIVKFDESKPEPVDTDRENLAKFKANPDPLAYGENLIKDYVKIQKYITVDVVKYFDIKPAGNFEVGLVSQEKDLTTDLLKEDKYQKVQFKKFNYNSFGKEPSNGALHPLLRVRTQFREILLELGFQEMPTNSFVESSFWNFDSLFQPQQHPARDAHDTFFLTHPKYSKVKDLLPEYFKRVKEVHEIGGYDSLGWKYNWSEEEASKNILRTHTTAVSSKMLFKMAEEYKKTGVFTPKKFFSIDRVFRNESLDATHLAEFHQIEGLVADYNLGLGHLLGTIEDFFHRFGIQKLKFKPAYNPYTEPSMEIYAWHEGFKRWVEVGNSGIFRPEMVLPMGLPKDVSVIAWGLSLERPTMIYYGLKNIRDLFGHEVNINNTKKAEIYCINID